MLLLAIAGQQGIAHTSQIALDPTSASPSVSIVSSGPLFGTQVHMSPCKHARTARPAAHQATTRSPPADAAGLLSGLHGTERQGERWTVVRAHAACAPTDVCCLAFSRRRPRNHGRGARLAPGSACPEADALFVQRGQGLLLALVLGARRPEHGSSEVEHCVLGRLAHLPLLADTYGHRSQGVRTLAFHPLASLLTESTPPKSLPIADQYEWFIDWYKLPACTFTCA